MYVFRQIIVVDNSNTGMKKILGKIRYVLAVVVLAGSAPNYFLLWALWRGVSLFLPQWKYQGGDDFLYSMYQRMVVFFFEHCTGQKVMLCDNNVLLL